MMRWGCGERCMVRCRYDVVRGVHGEVGVW